MKTILSFLAILIATYASAAIIYVSETASGANNGTSWANAYNDLQDGLANSNAGDEIWVAAGVYYPGTTRSSSFVLLDDVKLYGGFNGTETLLSDRGNYYDFPTTLSGDIGVIDDQSDNCYHVVRTSNALGEFYMDGFYIQYGAATSGSLNGIGGGISFQTCESATVRNCFIANNEANEGGGIHIRTSADNVSIEACVLGSNFAELGAAVYSEEAYYMESCLIAFNSCSKNGIIFDKLAAQIVNCTIVDNLFRNDFVTDFESTASMFNSIWYNNVNSTGVVDEGVFVRRSLISRIYEWDAILVQYADEDPFVDRTNFHYGLLETSRAIALGDVVYTENDLDLTGSDRIQSTRPDAGCLESPFVRTGCSDEDAFNYDPYFEVIDNDSCTYSPLCPGDFNGDFLVNASDLLILLSFFGDSCNIPFCGADMDGNSVTNANDLLLFLATFGNNCGGS